MADYDIDDILDFTASGSPTKVQDAVNAILGAKSIEALQGMKSSLAQSLYAEDGEPEEEDLETEDDEEDFDEDDFDEEDLEIDDEDIDWDEDALDLDIDLEGLEDNE